MMMFDDDDEDEDDSNGNTDSEAFIFCDRRARLAAHKVPGHYLALEGLSIHSNAK